MSILKYTAYAFHLLCLFVLLCYMYNVYKVNAIFLLKVILEVKFNILLLRSILASLPN